MEGTEPDVLASLGLEIDALADDADDVCGVADAVDVGWSCLVVVHEAVRAGSERSVDGDRACARWCVPPVSIAMGGLRRSVVIGTHAAVGAIGRWLLVKLNRSTDPADRQRGGVWAGRWAVLSRFGRVLSAVALVCGKACSEGRIDG